jgi:hypothetical protein
MSRLYARNKDGNHAAVVSALRACGASVEPIESIKGGLPDLLVGAFGITELVEVKDGEKIPSKRRLNADQQKWHREWKGRRVVVVESVEEALELVAKMRGAMTMSEVSQ